MITALTLLSLGCILAYTLSICIKFKGIPNSISSSFYSLEHKWWFRFTMWITSLLLMPAFLELSLINTQFLVFLCLIGMIIVGCFPDYINDKYQKKGHEIGAVMTMVCSQLWLAFNYWYILPFIWISYLIYTIIWILKDKSINLKDKYMNSNPLFWIEICCISSIFITLFILI